MLCSLCCPCKGGGQTNCVLVQRSAQAVLDNVASVERGFLTGSNPGLCKGNLPISFHVSCAANACLTQNTPNLINGKLACNGERQEALLAAAAGQVSVGGKQAMNKEGLKHQGGAAAGQSNPEAPGALLVVCRCANVNVCVCMHMWVSGYACSCVCVCCSVWRGCA